MGALFVHGLLIAALIVPPTGAVLPRRAASGPVDTFQPFASWEKVTFNSVTSACTEETEVSGVLGSPTCTNTNVTFPESGGQHAAFPTSSGLRMECCTGGAGLSDDFLTDTSDPWTLRFHMHIATGNAPTATSNLFTFGNNTTQDVLTARLTSGLDFDVRNTDNVRCTAGLAGGPLSLDTDYWISYEYEPPEDRSRICARENSWTDASPNCTPWCDGTGTGSVFDGLRMWINGNSGTGWADNIDWGST